MKQSSIISTWVLSFITMVVFAESPNVIFYLSFIVFTLMSLCIKSTIRSLKMKNPLTINTMNNQLRARLEDLYIELDAVNRMTELQAVSLYNCDYKQEVINLIQEDIKSTEKEVRDYEDDEFEAEQDNICRSLGISRYC